MTTPNLLCRQAMSAHQSGNLEQAKALYRQVLAVQSKDIMANYGLGMVFAQSSQPKKAIRHLKTAYEGAPTNVEILCNYANVCIEVKKYSIAEKCFKQALQQNGSIAEALNGLGVVYEHKKDLTQSLAFYQKGLSLNSGNPVFEENVLRVIKLLVIESENKEDWDEIRRLCALGLEIAPADHTLRSIYSDSLFIVGNIKEGLKWVPPVNPDSEKLKYAQWAGEKIEKGRLLIRAEQGIGDQLVFMSTLPEVIQQTEKLSVECDHRLVPLLARTYPDVDFFGWKEPPLANAHSKDIVAQSNMFETFVYNRPDFAAFPGETPVLETDHGLTDRLREKYVLEEGVKLVGISWASSNTPVANRKTIPLEHMISACRDQNFRFISLQYGAYEDEIRKVEKRLVVEIIQDDEIDPIGNLDTFSSAVKACDFVISCSNATVHFAGAVGTPVWAVLPAIPRWHWFKDRADCPWYDSVRLVRRSCHDTNWKNSLKEAKQSIDEWLANSHAPKEG